MTQPSTDPKKIETPGSDLGAIKETLTEAVTPKVKPELKLGETARLTAVHGDLEHPFVPGTVFMQGNGKKVEVDAWVKLQYDHDKLALEE